MKNILLLFTGLLLATTVQAQAPGTVKSATRISARPGSLGQSNNWGNVGYSTCSYPDRDGDGIRELVFLANDAANSVRGIYILGVNSNGTPKPNPIVISSGNSILSTVPTKYPGFNAEFIGTALTPLKDLNGNGVDELVATNGFLGGSIFVLFMNQTAGLDSFKMISDGYSGFQASGNPDGFGIDIANIGDVDKDGIEDLAVGSFYNESKRGGVYILFMKSNGTIKSNKYIGNNTGGMGPLSAPSYFGISVTGIGDLDNDGTPDIMVGSQINSTGVRGEVWSLLLKPDGSVKSYKIIQPNIGGIIDTVNQGSQFGFALTNIGDIDGDSITDVATSAWNYKDSLQGEFGRTHILFMSRDGTPKASQSIDRFHGNLSLSIDSFSRFGYDVTDVGDVNGDGIFDLAVGAPHSKELATPTIESGAIYILNLNGIPITTGVGDQLHNLTESYFLYPNPTSDVIRIRSRKPLATALQVRLLDAAGRTVKMASGEGSATLEIEVAHLPAGLYTIEMSNGKEVQWGKFIKN